LGRFRVINEGKNDSAKNVYRLQANV